jgi:tetratricopeptide (TPR) repeat protein
LILAALGLATVSVFAGTVAAGFLPWDDIAVLSTNPRFRGDLSSGVSWIVTARTLGHWIPLTWASFALDFAVWGTNPAGYHLTNVLLHAINGLLVFVVARRLLARALARTGSAALDAGALVAALAFTIHPMRVESVAWVTERRDMLSGAFFLLVVLAYLHAADQQGAARRRTLAWALLAFVASLLAKQITMSVPAVLLIMDAYPLRRLGKRGVLWEKAPFVLFAAAGAAVAALGQHADIGFTAVSRLGLVDRLAVFAHSLVYYPAATLVPVGLSPLHEMPASIDPLEPRFLASALLALAMTACAVLLRRRAPWLAAAWAYSTVSILPVSGLAHVSTVLVADRYSYLSTLSWALLLGGASAALLRSSRRVLTTVGLAVAALALVSWGVLAHAYAGAWQGPESLWRLAVDADPGCAQCHGHLGLELAARGRLAEAERACTLAVALRPDRADHHAFLASVHERQGRLDIAVAGWAAAASRHPRYTAEARRASGMALAARGRHAEAVQQLRTAHAERPSALGAAQLVGALNALAVRYVRTGQRGDARRVLEEALRVQPEHPVARGILAALGRSGHTADSGGHGRTRPTPAPPGQPADGSSRAASP